MAGVRSREPAPSERAGARLRVEAAPGPASSVWQLHQILDASPESVVCIDRGWHCTFVNQAARRILNAEDLVGANLWTRFPLNQEEPFASNYRATMEERVPTDFEAHYPEPLNTWFKIAVRPYDGGMIIFASDITARKEAEQLRDANARQLEQVLEATSDAVVSLDRDFHYTFLNRQARLLLGRDDLLGKNMWREFPSTEADVPLRRTMDERVALEFDVYNPAPLNRWFRVQTRPSEDGIVVFFRDVTEERAAQQVLLEQRATLAFVQEAARIATWTVDLATEAMRISDGSYPVFGRPNGEVRTLSDFRRLVLEEDRAAVRAGVARAVRTGEMAAADYRVTAPDGGVIWLEGRCLPVADATGRVTQLRGMTTDITARMENEQKLRASEERYRVLADLNPQTLWIGEPDGSISYTNQGHAEYRGVEAEELLGSRWLEGIYPEDREPMLKAWTHSLATGDEYGVESRILSREGEYRWWALRALPVRDEAGRILNWLGVAHDVHDLKMVAEELRRKQEETERQRAELETVYRTAPIGLALFDPVEFRYLRLNDRQAEIVGLPPERILGRTLTEIAPIEGLREMFQQVAQGSPVREQVLEGELPAKPGERRYWTVNYYPVYETDGTIRAITAATLEITQQKKAELALIQSEKLAAVGRLASSISHEINNPLEAITNLLYLVATDPKLHEETKVYVHLAQSELSRVSQIATHTLRFHRQAVRPTRVTAAELVGSVLGLYQGRLGNSNIRVEATYASQRRILCFENDLRQVLNNLIANAIDAMRNGGRLVVRAHEAEDWTAVRDGVGARRGVRITVADTGHGMPASVKARLFEPFYTTKDLNGTGLGLWISAGIVQHHKGRLTVRSSQDARHMGTVFTLFLPMGGESGQEQAEA